MPDGLANPPQTGIHGQLYRFISYGIPYWISPDIWIGIPSVQLPVATSFTLLSAHNGREVARVRTDAEGFYTVSVPPGKYMLVPDLLVVNAFFNCTASTDPIEVEVRAKQFTLQNVFYFSRPCVVFGGTNVVVPHS